MGQIKNIKLHIVTDIKCNMDTLTENIEQSEKTVAFLREQISILTALAAQKKEVNEAGEIKRLTSENESLGNELIELKETLQYYEVQNGVAQIQIPKHDTSPKEGGKSETAQQQQQPQKQQQPQQQQQQQGKNNNKPKKEKAEKKPAAPAVESDVSIDVSKLNMRVGKIVSVKKHPDADTLYVEEVDVGEEKNRTVVSGLVKSYTLEEMQDRVGVFLINLKPAKMRGVLSEGMIMCASSPEKVETLEVPAGATIGDRVECLAYPGPSDAQLNPKKKHWEAIQKDLMVTADGTASYKGDAFTIAGKGKCT